MLGRVDHKNTTELGCVAIKLKSYAVDKLRAENVELGLREMVSEIQYCG